VISRGLALDDAAVNESHFPVTETARMYKARFPRANLNAIQAHLFLGSVGTELSQKLHSFIGATGWSLSGARYSLLRLLYLSEGHQLAHNEIARALRYTPGNITQLMDGLVRQGLVERIPSENSRRVTLARLTNRGEACAATLVPAILDFMETTCSTLSEEEMDQLNHLLGKFLGGLRSAPSTAPSVGNDLS
jgi:DNA-binding MarR family transcriptional regulator